MGAPSEAALTFDPGTLRVRRAAGHGAGRFDAMASPCEVLVEGGNRRVTRRLTEIAAVEVHRIEAKFSRYRSDSVLARLHAAAGEPFAVDSETADLLDFAARCHRISEGAFDVTSGVLRRAWKFDGSDRVPTAAQVAELVPLVGWQRVTWQRPRLTFTGPGMELDLGGIVKEYAADRAAAWLVDAGISHALVNLGGDVRVPGPQPDGQPWRIGIRDPHRPGQLLVTLSLSQGALTSSGDYERCIVVDGVRHGHILDPRTGWPVQGLAAASVVAPLAVVAGSASTIAMLMGREGPAWLARSGLPHLWVDADGRAGGPLLDGHPSAIDTGRSCDLMLHNKAAARCPGAH